MDKNEPKIHTIKPYSKDNISACLDDIKRGRMTCYLASKRYGIPVSTLRYRLSGRWKKSLTPGPSTILSPMEEQEIVDWLQDMQSRGFFMTRAECVSKVSHYMMSVGRGAAFKNAQPGRKWCELFLRRNATFSMSKTMTVVSAEHIRNWFRTMKQWFIKNNHLEILKQPARIFIVEEIFLNFPGQTSTTANVPTGDIAVMFGFGASGSIVPPNIVVPADRVPQDFKMLNLPPGWGMEVCERGWFNTQTFRSYILTVFHPFLVKQSVKLPVVLFVDGHALPQISEIDELCQSLGIILVSPYRATNDKTVTQSANLGMFNVIKTKWTKTLSRWCTDNPKSMHTMPYFGNVLQISMEQGSFSSEIHNGFWSSGLYPFNSEAVDYSKYPTNAPEIITQLEESVSTDPLDDAPGYSEADQESEPVASEQVSISINRIYEAYDLIDSQTRMRIQGDIRDLTREERIIRFFYREFIQPNVHFKDNPLEKSFAVEENLQFEEMMIVKSEPPDSDCENEDKEPIVLSSAMGEPVKKETCSEPQTNVDTIDEQLNTEAEPFFKDGSIFCRMCGHPHGNNQRYNYIDFQNEPKMRAVLQLCFAHYDALHSAESVCRACFREIGTFREFLQNCHEGQRRLNRKLKQNTNSNTKQTNQSQNSTSHSQQWPCHRCGKVYDTKSDLHQHFVNDHGEITYTCDICYAVLKSKMTLYQHRRSLHAELKKCAYCTKRFLTDKMYEKHLQVHFPMGMGESATGQPPYDSYMEETNHRGTDQGDDYEAMFSKGLPPDAIKYEQYEYDDEASFSGTMQ